MNNRTCPSSWIALAHRLADIARPVARQYFRTSIDIISKADDSPVTIADRTIEAAMREEIERTFPDHGILGEEHGAVRMESSIIWVLDPIDGTKAFISGMPTFGTLISCCVNGVPVLGLIDQPILEDRWVGATGHGTVLNNQAAYVSKVTDLSRSVLYSTDPAMFAGDPKTRGYYTLQPEPRLVRYGGDCYAHGLLASGYIDLVVEAQLQPYDYCALVPVIVGAGGLMTDWEGQALTLDSDGRTVSAATPDLHRAALEKLSHGPPDLS